MQQTNLLLCMNELHQLLPIITLAEIFTSTKRLSITISIDI